MLATLTGHTVGDPMEFSFSTNFDLSSKERSVMRWQYASWALLPISRSSWKNTAADLECRAMHASCPKAETRSTLHVSLFLRGSMSYRSQCVCDEDRVAQKSDSFASAPLPCVHYYSTLQRNINFVAMRDRLREKLVSNIRMLLMELGHSV